jgi:hypothetical protein
VIHFCFDVCSAVHSPQAFDGVMRSGDDYVKKQKVAADKASAAAAAAASAAASASASASASSSSAAATTTSPAVGSSAGGAVPALSLVEKAKKHMKRTAQLRDLSWASDEEEEPASLAVKKGLRIVVLKHMFQPADAAGDDKFYDDLRVRAVRCDVCGVMG